VLVNCKSAGIAIYRRRSEWGSFYGNIILRNNTILQKNKDFGPAIKLGDDSFENRFLFLNNLILATNKNIIALEIPVNFHGVCLDNYVFGNVTNEQKGVNLLPDLSNILSLNFGDVNFLYPTNNFNSNKPLNENTTTHDFNGTKKLVNKIGAYSDFSKDTALKMILKSDFKTISK
jgi:hypothetical protein